METRDLMIVKAPCWQCEKPMLVALAAEHDGPETFSKGEQDLARKHGVLLKMVHSSTAQETYLANYCSHCNAFVGKWYYFAHYWAPAMYGQYEYEGVGL